MVGLNAARGWVLVAGMLALSGCQPDSQQAVLSDYLQRLSRVTGVTTTLTEPAPGPRYPARRRLQREIPAHSIDVAQFFALHGCDMGALVGFRNSPLGRVQSASQRLGYEAAWLSAAQRCGADAADWMTALATEKRAWLPALFWNATFGADEIRIALGGAAAPASGDLADLLRSLNDTYTGLLQGEFDVDGFESLLGRLRQGSWAGPARRDWSLWRRYLRAASAALDGAAPGICPNRRPNTATGRLQNVFRKFYVARVQPQLAQRMHRQQAWIAELARLSERLAAVRPAAFQGWFDAVLAPDQPDSEWQRTRRAVVAHAEAWQRLFAFCGIEPGPGLGQD